MKKTLFSLASLSLIAAAWLLDPTGWGAAVAAAFIASWALMRYGIHYTLAIAYRRRLFDQPGGRHIHTTPIPRLGGLAFAPIICCTTILGLAIHQLIWPAHHLDIPHCLTWISALIFIHMIGAVDDLAGVGYRVKFGAQITAALLVVASGVAIGDFGGVFGIHALPSWLAGAVTVVFIVAVINALNLIDGMDGLAAGTTALILTIYCVRLFASGQPFLSMIAAAGVGTVIPFLWSNVRGVGARRRKLFMGDTGSQTLGLVVGVLAAAQITSKDGTVIASHDLILALSPLVVPLFDMVHVAVGRMLRGSSPFLPDTTHIHHRIARLGFSPRQVVGAIVAAEGIVVVFNSVLSLWLDAGWILSIDILAWCVLNGVMNYKL